MTKQDQKAISLGGIVVFIIVALSLLSGTANGADTYNVKSINGVSYRFRITERGEFLSVYENGSQVARRAITDSYYGYALRGGYNQARQEILRGILPEATANIGTIRAKLVKLELKTWESSEGDKAIKTDVFKTAEEIKALLKKSSQERDNYRSKIKEYEAQIYNSLPALLAQVESGELDEELRRNGANRELAIRIINGALESVDKITNKYYKASYKFDSEPY